MKKIALYENPSKPEARKWAEYAARKIIALNAVCYASQELIDSFPDELASQIIACPISNFEKFIDVVISFGGDGTMLTVSRILVNADIPIMGFNVGKLGFLAEYSICEIDESLNDLISGNYRIVDRAILETEINGETIYALNDFVIEKKNSSRMITIEAFSNQHCIGIYRADGLIITTPTGSTAYSLSCGGPIIAPSTQVICLTPISPHSLTFRPLVIPDTTELAIKASSGSNVVNFVADGQTERLLKSGEQVVIKRSKELCKLIKPLNSSYFDLLREKLLWAADGTSHNPKQ